MELQVFVDIERVQGLGVKTGQEHVDDQQDVDALVRCEPLPVTRLHALSQGSIVGVEAAKRTVRHL